MNPNKVIVASKSFGRVDPSGANMLRDAGLELVYLPGKRSTNEELSELMRDDLTIAVIAGAEPITGEMIRSSPNLKIIAMHGVGLNHIDLQTAQTCNIVVKAVPGGNAQAVADLTWGLIFAVTRKIAEADAAVRLGDWSKKYIGTSVNNKTLGIIGFGAIGQAVAKRACGFNMRILAADVNQDQAAAESLNVKFEELETLLKEADIITLHVPLMESTTALISEKELELMKSSAILINVSRGGVVDEKALCQALVENKIAGAGVDVFTQEPLPVYHPLISAPNCVLTPHIGARSFETIKYIGNITARNILESLKI